jgi:hypothetical protein
MFEDHEEFYRSICNMIEFVKNSGVESCDCPNCMTMRNSVSWCQHYVDNYKTERKLKLN